MELNSMIIKAVARKIHTAITEKHNSELIEFINAYSPSDTYKKCEGLINEQKSLLVKRDKIIEQLDKINIQLDDIFSENSIKSWCSYEQKLEALKKSEFDKTVPNMETIKDDIVIAAIGESNVDAIVEQLMKQYGY